MISISFQSIVAFNYHVQLLKETLEKGEKGREETTTALRLKSKENKSLSLFWQSKYFLQPSTNV